jgi:hypothetical protein
MPAYTEAIVRRVSGDSIDHSVGGIAGDVCDGQGRAQGAGARLIIGDILYAPVQQRSQENHQGPQRTH